MLHVLPRLFVVEKCDATRLIRSSLELSSPHIQGLPSPSEQSTHICPKFLSLCTAFTSCWMKVNCSYIFTGMITPGTVKPDFIATEMPVFPLKSSGDKNDHNRSNPLNEKITPISVFSFIVVLFKQCNCIE